MSQRKEVKVILRPDGTIEVRPPLVRVSKKDLDSVEWVCEVGEATVQFKKESPFVSKVFVAPEGGAVCSGPALGNEGQYEYGVSIRVPGDRRVYSIDPHVQVDA
jgi:hypothetical protein